MNGYGWVEGNTPNLRDATGRSSGTCGAPSQTLTPNPPVSPFLTNTKVDALSPTDTVAMCAETRIVTLVEIKDKDGNLISISKKACEDYFGFLEATNGESLTYKQLFGILTYTEFHTVADNQEVYALVKEALARQYFELAGSDGLFSTPEELFTFLGGIEGWYGHHPTQMVGQRFPLVWLRDTMTTGEWVENPDVPTSEYRKKFSLPDILSAYTTADSVWSETAWREGYGDCSTPARWGNTATLPRSQLASMPTPGGSSQYAYFIVQPPFGCGSQK